MSFAIGEMSFAIGEMSFAFGEMSFSLFGWNEFPAKRTKKSLIWGKKFDPLAPEPQMLRPFGPGNLRTNWTQSLEPGTLPESF